MGTPRSKKKLTTKQLKDFAQEMHKQASHIEATIEVAEKQGISWLEVSNYPTGVDGIDSITKFTAAIFQAISAHTLREALDGSKMVERSRKETLSLTDARKKQGKKDDASD